MFYFLITLSQDSLLDFFYHGKSSCRICSCRFSKCVLGKILHWYTCNYGNETSWAICVYIKYSLIYKFTPYSKTHVSLIKMLVVCHWRCRKLTSICILIFKISTKPCITLLDRKAFRFNRCIIWPRGYNYKMNENKTV